MNDTPNTGTLVLPLFPLRNSMLFPHMLAPYSAGRPASLGALEAAVAREDKELVVVAQRDVTTEEPSLADLYSFGTRALIKRMARAEETIEVIVQGLERVRVTGLHRTEKHLEADVEPAPVLREQNVETEALERELVSLAGKIPAIAERLAGFDITSLQTQVEQPMQLVYLLGSLGRLDLEQAQALLDVALEATPQAVATG
jgi:ATP-dependent Lon protease